MGISRMLVRSRLLLSAQVASTVGKQILFFFFFFLPPVLYNSGKGLACACSTGHLLTTILKGAMGQPASSCTFWFLREQSEHGYSLWEQMLILRGMEFRNWPWLFFLGPWMELRERAYGDSKLWGVKRDDVKFFRSERQSCRQDVWHGRDHWLRNALFHLR